MPLFGSDLRLAARALRRRPAFTLLAVLTLTIGVGRRGEAIVRMVGSATGNYFDVVGVRPALGRLPPAAESFYPSVAPVAVTSDRLWRERFGSERAVVGKTLRVNGVALEVIG